MAEDVLVAGEPITGENLPETKTMSDHRSLFRNLLQGMYDAVLITDSCGHFLAGNARMKEWFLYSNDDLYDVSVCEKLIPGLNQDTLDRIIKALSTNKRVVLDTNCLRSDGTRFPCEISVCFVDFVHKDDLVFIVHNLERRKKNLAILYSEVNACKLSQAAMFGCDSEGKFKWSNPAFRDMFNVTETELSQQKFSDIFDAPELQEALEKAYNGETSKVRLEVETDDGKPSEWIEVKLGADNLIGEVKRVVGSVIRVV